MMKKILSILLVIFLQLPQLSIAIEKPSFKEFCPEAYYHKELMPVDWYEPAKYSTWAKTGLWCSILVFVYPAIITYPLAISDTEWRRKQRAKKIIADFNSSVEYWRQREESFNQSLALCDKTQDTASCYLQVKINEQQKNLAIENNRLLRGIGLGITGIQAQQANTNFQLYQMRQGY